MNELVDRFGSLEAEIANQRGSFALFALVSREDLPDRWDLLISAPWATKNRQDAVKYLVGEIQSHLPPQDLINLSRIVVVDWSEPPVQAFTDTFQVEHGRVEVMEKNIFGLPVKHAFVITSKRPESPVLK
jgi:hypothetical protein